MPDTRQARRSAAWLLAIADVVVFVVASAYALNPDLVADLVFGAAIASCAGVGALLFVRVPRNPIGALLLAAATIWPVGIALGTYAEVGWSRTPPWPGSTVAAIIGDLCFVYPIALVLIGVPLIFPDGRFPSRRFRWVAWLAVAAMAGSTITSLLGTHAVGSAEIENPLAITALKDPLAVLATAVNLSSIIGFGGAAVAVWTRFHRGDPVVREQTKWLVAVAGVAAIAFPLAFIVVDTAPEVGNVLFAVGLLAMAAMPLAIGIAILRYRLFEIDRIVSRTIAYALVTGLLLATFGAANLLLQSAVAPVSNDSALAVAASTLLVAALFQPVMRRVRRSVDRRFDRARYDAERTAAAFAERLRDEVDMGTVTADLTGTARAALAPTALGVWIRRGGA